MPRTPRDVLADLKATTPYPPFVKRPTSGELVDALRRFADHDATAAVARQLVEAWEAADRFVFRYVAVRTAIHSHYTHVRRGFSTYAKRCDCAKCKAWRAELDAMSADKEKAAK
jgi:hypothetical protein